MAIKTRKILKDTTAVAGVQVGNAVVPMHGKNEPNLLTETAIKAMASVAMADADTAKTKNGSADQRMAYAVIAMHAILVFRQRKPVALEQMHVSDEGRSAFVAEVADTLIGVKPTLSDTPDTDEHTAMSAYVAHKALLTRACKLAGGLSKRGVVLDDFNMQLGNWTVPFTTLFNPADKVDFTENQKTRHVFLDNRTYGVTGVKADGKDKSVKAQASVRQFMSTFTVTAPKPKADNKVDAGQGTSDADKAAIHNASADSLSINAVPNNLIRAVKKYVIEGDDKHDTILSDFGDAFANDYTDLVKHFDVMRQREPAILAKRAADKAAKAAKPNAA